MPEALRTPPPDPLRNLYLLVSGDCNLACSYCYADGGSFGGAAGHMSAATMEAALEVLLPADAEVTISFFGGEPLLNLQLMQHTVARGTAIAAARNTRLHFVLTTNGTLLDDERLAFLKAHIRHVAVSLDGSATLTDGNRRFRRGNDSVHQRVVANLRRLREAGIAYGLRGTIPEDAVDALEESVAVLSGLGATSLRVDPAFSAIPWRKESHQRWTAATARLNHAAVDQVLAGENPLVARDLYRVAAHHIEGDKRQYPCLAGQGILAVSPAGDVYPCDHFVGQAAFRMGNVHDGDFPGERFLRVSERMEWNLVEARPRCTNCRIRHICGGECPAHSYLRQGDIAEPSPCHCAQTKPAVRELEKRLAGVMADPAGRARLQAWLRGD